MEELIYQIIVIPCKFIETRIHYLFYKCVGKDKPFRIVSRDSYSIFNTLIGLFFFVGLTIVSIHLLSKITKFIF